MKCFIRVTYITTGIYNNKRELLMFASKLFTKTRVTEKKYVLQREMDGKIEYNFTIKPLRLTATRFHKCKEQKNKNKKC